MVLFLRNKRFNFMLFWGDYYLRWWRLPIEEHTCRKTDLGGGDYYLRNTGLPPSSDTTSSLYSFVSLLQDTFQKCLVRFTRTYYS